MLTSLSWSQSWILWWWFSPVFGTTGTTYFLANPILSYFIIFYIQYESVWHELQTTSPSGTGIVAMAWAVPRFTVVFGGLDSLWFLTRLVGQPDIRSVDDKQDESGKWNDHARMKLDLKIFMKNYDCKDPFMLYFEPLQKLFCRVWERKHICHMPWKLFKGTAKVKVYFQGFGPEALHV